ncbi:MAG: MbnP family protein [Cyclobacteriaceae bacterium]
MRLFSYWFLLFTTAIFISCEENLTEGINPTNDSIQTNTLTFYFDHTVDGQGVVYNDIRYQNDAGNQFSVNTLRYFISDIRLHSYNGATVKLDTFHYRDIDIPQTRSITIKDVPNGQYNYISFIFGLDSIRNKDFALPPTQDYNNMEWPIPMGGGYHYMKFEGRYILSNGETGNFNTHTGRLKTMDGTIYENFIHINLPESAFEMKDDNWEMQVYMNLNEWYRNPHVYDIENFGQAIMNNQEAQQMLKENGADAFSIGYINRY